MQGDMIEWVEVIINFFVWYEVEGEVGIINIIFKKEEKKGFNGFFGFMVGQFVNYGVFYNFNYCRWVFNFFFNFGLDYWWVLGGGNVIQCFFENGELINFFISEIS